jgi:multidrug efflux pump subunit AcrA (membrane-fusion protein)
MKGYIKKIVNFGKTGSSIWFGGVCLLLMLGLTGCPLLPKERAEDIPALVQAPQEDMATYTVNEEPINEEITGSGRVGSSLEKTLYFLIAGRVREVMVEYNGNIKKGQPLLALETGDLEYALRQAKTAFEQEQLRFEQQYGNNSDAKNELQIAELALAKAKLDLESAKDRLRTEGPLSTGFQKKALERDVERAEIQYRQSKIPHERIQSQNTPNSVAQRIAALAVERARIEYERLTKQMDNSVLRAPFDGKITSLKVARGEMVEAFAPVETVSAIQRMELIVEIEFDKMLRLKPGMPVQVHMEEGKIEMAHIALIDKPQFAVSGKREIYYAHIRMDDPKVSLKMESYYSVTMITRSVKNGLVLPNQAIWWDANGSPYIRAVEGKQRRDVYIKLGITNQTKSQIIEGAQAGMTVIGNVIVEK